MKKRFILFLSLGLFGCLATWNQEQAEATASKKVMYVAPAGKDTNSGSLKRPLKTLKRASQLAKAGTTVYLRQGTYTEALTVRYSGTKQAPVVFRNYQTEKVVLSGKALKKQDGETTLIRIENLQYVTIQGLVVADIATTRNDETPIGICITGTGRNIQLIDNQVRRIKTNAKGGNAHGIAIYGTGRLKQITVRGNRVEDNRLGASEALVLNGNIDGFSVTDNIVRRNDNIGIDLIGYEGVATNNSEDYVRNGVISGNHVSDSSSYGNPVYGKDYNAAGIYVDGGKQLTIEHNTVEQNDIGIEVTSEHAKKYAEDITVRGNLVQQNRFTGISIGGYDKKRGGTKRVRITDNQVNGNDTKGLEGGQLLVQHDVRDNRIDHNAFTTGRDNLFVANFFKTSSGNQFDHNTYQLKKGTAKRWIWLDHEYRTQASFERAVKGGLNK